MLRFECPYCDKDIELMGTKDIKLLHNLGPNAINARRKEGRFPEPVIDIVNRLLWTRVAVDEAMAKEAETKTVNFAHGLGQSLEALPREERERVIQILLEQVKEVQDGDGGG